MRTTIPAKVVDNPDRRAKNSRSKLKENRSGRFLTRLQIDEIVRRTAAKESARIREKAKNSKFQRLKSSRIECRENIHEWWWSESRGPIKKHPEQHQILSIVSIVILLRAISKIPFVVKML